MVDHEAFLQWAESRFGEVRERGCEIMINSPWSEEAGFKEDNEFKLWCNTAGGKNKRSDGVYHCWKSDKVGSLVKLVMLTDNCPFEDAIQVIRGNVTTNSQVEAKLRETIWGHGKTKEEVEDSSEDELKIVELKLPDFAYRISELIDGNQTKERAESYLKSRNLDVGRMLICTRGRYANRIIIPYYGPDDDLIYFNARHLKSDFDPKYLGPPKETGIGKGDVLFLPSWPEHGRTVFICEGEFDAMSLRACGFYAAACGGKSLTDTQIEMLRNYKICLALDNDGAGKAALNTMFNKLYGAETGGEFNPNLKITYVSPPQNYKDWNSLLQDKPVSLIVKYIVKTMKVYDIDKW